MSVQKGPHYIHSMRRKMTNNLAKLILVIVSALLLVACGSNSSDVPSLNTEGTQRIEPTTDAALDEEAKMMAFTQCMRDQGIELMDPGVDSEGDVQRPELAEGVEVTREELGAAYEACAEHLEGLTFGREREDVSQQVDTFVALATCLRDKGYDVDDPTAETLDQWGADFRAEFDWDDPEAMAAYEECSSAD
jgi:hypothetical protein